MSEFKGGIIFSVAAVYIAILLSGMLSLMRNAVVFSNELNKNTLL